jgi:hypothetical protein
MKNRGRTVNLKRSLSRCLNALHLLPLRLAPLHLAPLLGALALGCGGGDDPMGSAPPPFEAPEVAPPPVATMTPDPEGQEPPTGDDLGEMLPGEVPNGMLPLEDPEPEGTDGAAAEPEPPAEPAVPDGPAPVTPNASPEARKLLAYLYEQYGVKMLSGQMESTWMQGGADYELNYIETVTGKLPAVKGLDFIEYNGVAQRAIEWWERGGIPNIRWHWGAPTHGNGYDASQEAVDIDRVLTPGTPEYVAMMAGLERTAQELATIRDANVPVLWTPFHELNGNWFWWGKQGPERFIRLWRFMFDYFTEEKGLNNLIWVLGYTGQPNGDWYPGREYVDIAGADTYAATEEPQLRMFDAVRNIVGNEMPVTFHECGVIPNPTLAREQGATWSWFMTWHTDYLTDANTPEHLRAVYADDFVITLDELPSLR